MARKKIVLVIVEGPSDDSALGVILNRLFDKNKVHIADDRVVENPDAEKPVYTLTNIQTAKRDLLLRRNKHK